MLLIISVLVLLIALLRTRQRAHDNVELLLGALKNGDYSFRFVENSRRRRDVNAMLNDIKVILARAREGEIRREQFLSIIVAAVPTGIVVVDGRGFVRAANDAALRMLGLPVFTHLRQLPPELRRDFEALAEGRRATVRVVDEREQRQVSLGLTEVDGLRVVTMQNIAGELEEREMESWVKLIRVMTHEIMNSVAPITSLSEAMAEQWGGAENSVQTAQTAVKTAPAADLRRNTIEAFDTIAHTARGLQHFVAGYRSFSGIPKPNLQLTPLVPLAERVGGLHGARVVVAEDVAAAIDAGQIEQVLTNLLKNAAEAGSRDIEIRVGMSASGAVAVSVSNDGAPLSDDVLPHIFVPFFTTKPDGTGVGLSVSRHIMRLHGGNLTHRRAAGRTIFTLEF